MCRERLTGRGRAGEHIWEVEGGRGWRPDKGGTVGTKAPAWFAGSVVLLGKNYKSSTFRTYLFSFRVLREYIFSGQRDGLQMSLGTAEAFFLVCVIPRGLTG